MYSEGSPAVKQSNETAFSYFKKAADKVITIVEFFVRFSQIIIYNNIISIIWLEFVNKNCIPPTGICYLI